MFCLQPSSPYNGLTDRMFLALFTEQSVNKINAPNIKYQRFLPHTWRTLDEEGSKTASRELFCRLNTVHDVDRGSGCVIRWFSGWGLFVEQTEFLHWWAHAHSIGFFWLLPHASQFCLDSSPPDDVWLHPLDPASSLECIPLIPYRPSTSLTSPFCSEVTTFQRSSSSPHDSAMRQRLLNPQLPCLTIRHWGNEPSTINSLSYRLSTSLTPWFCSGLSNLRSQTLNLLA